jgi:hypothetical protein
MGQIPHPPTYPTVPHPTPPPKKRKKKGKRKHLSVKKITISLAGQRY